jgi:hypothetical protein
MRWLAATSALLTASLCLLAWIYLRNRDTSDWRPPTRKGQLARTDAARALIALGGSDCSSSSSSSSTSSSSRSSSSGCAAELLGRDGSDRWLVRLTVGGRSECLRIDLRTFAVSERQGLSGVQPSRCIG